MGNKTTIHGTMRIWHRYLGFFLAGIMAVYAISGVVLIFRNTDFLKREEQVTKILEPGLSPAAIARAIRVRDLKIESEQGDVLAFPQGTYNKATGTVTYTRKSLPVVLEKLTQLHKSNTRQPLFYLNIFFGGSLLFFVLSSFWMFLPGTTIFRKGLYFTLAGFVLTLVLVWM